MSVVSPTAPFPGFTGDLAETGRFAIFPWFPPHDVDVFGVRWIEVVRRHPDWAARARNTRRTSPTCVDSA